jgi:hypothetical protein
MNNRITDKHTNGPALGIIHDITNSSKLLRAALLALLLGLGVSTPALAGQEPSDGYHSEGSDPLALFQDLYWRWTYGGLNLPVDANSNAVVHDVVMMAIPSTPGDGTPGTQAVTLNACQTWMLPLWNLLGTSYTNGTSDPIIGLNTFKTLNIKFTIDGKTVVSTKNVLDYFSRFNFNPPVPLNYPPVNAIVWFEGVGVLHGPLSPGHHTLKLDAKNTIPLPPNFGAPVTEYHNTWNVTVKPDE